MSNERLHRFNRQNIDYLLTDLLPFEKGNHYTHRFLYEYLQTNKKDLTNIIKNVKVNSKYFNNKWHSAPLKFKVSKKNGNFREISMINPLGLIESLVFIELFEHDIINITHNKDDFSVRKAKRTNSLTYKKNNKQTVYYSDSSKKQLLITLESSGNYFTHSPFKTITDLLNHRSFTFQRDRFKLLNIVDIQDCFPSIYTHSYKWLISNKIYDSKKLKDSNSIYVNIDQFSQNINGSKTNGIIVGPEISRLLAEFLFVHLDQMLINNLKEKGIINNQNCKILRFVDDYYIFSNESETQHIVKTELSKLINEFQLKINELKETSYKREDTLNSWMYDLIPLMSDIRAIFKVNSELQDELINLIYNQVNNEKVIADAFSEAAPSIYKKVKKGGNSRKIMYKDVRSKLNMAINSNEENSLISSYILSTILKKIEDSNNELDINMEINELVCFILLTYTKFVNYASTQKVIRMFVLLFDLFEDNYIKEIIGNNIERFQEDIFNNHPSDWVDILLFISNYEIDLSNSLIERLTKKILSEEIPTHIAALSLMAESKFINSRSIVRRVNSLVKRKLQNINWNDFFQDQLSWWVFIFLSYPKLNSNLKKEMELKLKSLQRSSDESVSKAESLIINFLLKEKFHFIEWNFSKDSYYKKYFYFTKDRTVFNPNVNDQINTSR